jgi:hypothetical protein
MGRKIKSFEINLGLNKIEINSLNEGNYILLLQTTKGVFNQRIVVQ